MKQNKQRLASRVFLGLGIVAPGIFLSELAMAQSEAAASYAAWNAAFLEQNNGNPYHTNEETNLGDTVARLYVAGLDIAVDEDVYQQTHSPSQRNLIISLLNTFLLDNVSTSSGTQGENGTNWSYDGYDDDLGWMVNAVLRGYQYTGIARYLTIAEQNWNTGYNRGWDSNLGGGIWENTSHVDKEALSNDPFVFTGVQLYQITGDATYLTKAKAIYAWVRTNLVNTTTSNNSLGAPGQVNQGIAPNGTLIKADNVYNAGNFVTAAMALYRVTGDQQYLSDAERTVTHIVNEEPTLSNSSEACGCQWAYWFTYGVSQLATDANLWSKYLPYLTANANTAWSHRNAKNLTWNQWTAPTTNAASPGQGSSNGNPDEVEMQSAVAVWQHLPPPALSLTGTYEIESVASGLGLNVANNSATAGAAIIQFPFSGAANSLWKFVPTSGGYYQIQSVRTGQVINVSGASAVNGAAIVQWPAQPVIPGNDEWMPVANSDGTYSFYNLNSLQALDVPGGSTATSTQLDQWFGNSTNAQKFRLVAQ